MLRSLAILLCAFSAMPLMALDTGSLMKACSEAQITLVIQTWSPEGRTDASSAPRPVFEDSVLDVFKDKAADPAAVTDKLIKELAPALAKQEFHIFRSGGLLWIAPQGAPPLFGMSVSLHDKTTWTLDAMIKAFANETQGGTMPLFRNQRGVIKPMEPISITLEPGDYSLARALFLTKKRTPEVLGWTIHSFQMPGHSGGTAIYFEVHPIRPKIFVEKLNPGLTLR